MKPITRSFLLLMFGLFACSSCSAQGGFDDARPAPPAEPISVPRPAEVTFDAAEAAAGNLPRLYSLLVGWQGALVLECYYNGRGPTRVANIKSASKSIMSALVGIAIDRGVIENVGQPIGSFFSDLLGSADDLPKREITIEDLLTMRSGLQTTSNRYYGAWVGSRNWVQYALDRPLLRQPGTRMDYSTGNTHLLSAILTSQSGTSTWQFAQEVLAKPLGFSLARWPRDPQGLYFGGNDMELTPKQMLAFGEMYLNGGRANGHQIVPESWVAASLTPRTRSTRDRNRFYGYGWWIRQLGGHQTFYAWGYGGQFIFLIPDLDLVVVTTSSINNGRDRRGHLRRVYDLVERFVVAPIDAAFGMS